MARSQSDIGHGGQDVVTASPAAAGDGDKSYDHCRMQQTEISGTSAICGWAR